MMRALFVTFGGRDVVEAAKAASPTLVESLNRAVLVFNHFSEILHGPHGVIEPTPFFTADSPRAQAPIVGRQRFLTFFFRFSSAASTYGG